jgi:hypothetical protein
VTTPWIVASIVTGVWLLVALLQLGDVATAFLDSRTARDRDVPGRIARERTNELFWVLPVAALVALAIGVAIDQAGRYFIPGHGYALDSLALAPLFLLGLAVMVVGIATLALAATTRGSESRRRSSTPFECVSRESIGEPAAGCNRAGCC